MVSLKTLDFTLRGLKIHSQFVSTWSWLRLLICLYVVSIETLNFFLYGLHQDQNLSLHGLNKTYNLSLHSLNQDLNLSLHGFNKTLDLFLYSLNQDCWFASTWYQLRLSIFSLRGLDTDSQFVSTLPHSRLSICLYVVSIKTLDLSLHQCFPIFFSLRTKKH